MAERVYIAIDLKSFYASVECAERGLDPLTTHLVVADESRTEKTICLAVSPSLKAYGIPGRGRLFEVNQKVREINAERLSKAPGHKFSGASSNKSELQKNPALALEFITATPQMAHYIECSTKIYNTYLKYISEEDIHVYSIDEVFIDATDYLKSYRMNAHDLTMKMILDVLNTSGVTATAGIGTNLYLAKVAMDIRAKHITADKNGVRIAELDEMTYRRQLWSHRSLRDFWRVGWGYAKKLEANGLYTMGDIARCSINDEEKLYSLFGVNAELLIDHAWGWEPCTIAEIKAYKPDTNSLSTGQVLSNPYPYEKAGLIAREMADTMSLDLVEKGLVTDQITLTIGFDSENLTIPGIRDVYTGPITTDYYGRSVPKSAHGSTSFDKPTSSTRLITEAVNTIFEQIVDKNLLVRRVYLNANHVVDEASAQKQSSEEQLDLFTDYKALQAQKEREEAELEREKKMQNAVLAIKKRYGKNSILKGTNLEDGATMISRNDQIGGHKK